MAALMKDLRDPVNQALLAAHLAYLFVTAIAAINVAFGG